jgi:hypothetical protein
MKSSKASDLAFNRRMVGEVRIIELVCTGVKAGLS